MPNRLFALLFISLLLLASCDRKPATSTGTPAIIPMTPEERLVTMSIQLAPSSDTSKKGTDNIKVFLPRDTVHGVITTNNASDGMLLTGRWYYMKTGLKIAENRATLSSGVNMSHFDLIKTAPWPVGQYKLIVYLDSTAKDSAQFSVVSK